MLTKIPVRLFLELGKFILKFIQKNKTCKSNWEYTGQEELLTRYYKVL